MATVNEATPGSQDLATFQTVVQQQEGIFGPLIALWNEDSQNVMTFKIGPGTASPHRAILSVYTEHPPEREGHVLVCIGNCLVSGMLRQVAAYRAKP